LFRSEFRQIQELYLPNNEIKVIEEKAFAHLTNMILIDLDGNQIRRLNRKVFENNRKLERIDLRKNQIKMIDPQMMKNLNRLRVIELKDNECIDRNFGCSLCAEIDRIELNREMRPCYDNSIKNMNLHFLNEGETYL
jgi:Leucine-rich repeat (LRR) protein